MEEYVTVGTKDDVESGSGIVAEVNGQSIAVFNVDELVNANWCHIDSHKFFDSLAKSVDVAADVISFQGGIIGTGEIDPCVDGILGAFFKVL